MNNARPTWDEMFMEMAQTLAKRSTCSRRHVGAVFVRDNRYLCGGYNGAPAGEKHCDHSFIDRDTHLDQSGKRTCSIAIHAEMNAILDAALRGVSIQGAVLYVTHPPCLQCAKHLKQLRLERIVCPKE